MTIDTSPVRPNVLIVDDEPELVEIIGDIITPLNLNFFTAKNGREALEVVRHNSIDLVITDIKMPELSGLEFLAKIRDEHFSTIVIFVTGFGDKELMRQAWKLGAFDFIDKPIDEVYLYEITKTALAYGKSYLKGQPKHAVKTEKLLVNLDSNLYQELAQLCKSKNLDKDSIINSLIAKFLASGSR